MLHNISHHRQYFPSNFLQTESALFTFYFPPITIEDDTHTLKVCTNTCVQQNACKQLSVHIPTSTLAHAYITVATQIASHHRNPKGKQIQKSLQQLYT